MTTDASRPPVVVLCGSTRFYNEFQQANYALTMAGAIVLSVGFYPHAAAEHGHGEGVGHNSDEKIALDELHKRKIDLADLVYVLDVDGYIGESTRSEITYAEEAGKPIAYLTGGAAPATLAARARPVPDCDPMPVFVIKAKDRLAPDAIAEYRNLCIVAGLHDQASEVEAAFLEVADWQRRHPELVKAPDHPHVPAGQRP